MVQDENLFFAIFIIYIDIFEEGLPPPTSTPYVGPYATFPVPSHAVLFIIYLAPFLK